MVKLKGQGHQLRKCDVRANVLTFSDLKGMIQNIVLSCDVRPSYNVQSNLVNPNILVPELFLFGLEIFGLGNVCMCIPILGMIHHILLQYHLQNRDMASTPCPNNVQGVS